MVRVRDVSEVSDDASDGGVLLASDASPPRRATRKVRRGSENKQLKDGSRDRKKRSKSPSSERSDIEESSSLTRILGEQRIRSELFYFILHDDDVIRKYPARDVKSSYDSLINDYENSREEDSLVPFDLEDPRLQSRDKVHRLRSAHSKHTSNSAVSNDKPPKSGRSYRESDEESKESSEDVASGGSDYEHEEEPAPRRSTRHSNVVSKKKIKPSVPSPKKQTRTSGRQRKSVTYSGMQQASESDSHDSDNDVPPPPKVKKPKVARPKVRMAPAYGIIRHTRELSDDDDDDDRDRLYIHRDNCEKCGEMAAHKQLLTHRRKKHRGKKRRSGGEKSSDEEITEGETDFDALGGWIRCMKCCVVSHWRCLGVSQREDILRAIKEKESGEPEEGKTQPKRKKLEVFETTEFVCAACSKEGVCIMCKGVTTVKFQAQIAQIAPTPSEDVIMKDDSAPSVSISAHGIAEPSLSKSTPLLFRCITCKRAAHYDHLLVDGASDVQEVAMHYQDEKDWTCDDCESFVHRLESILAWRPYPPDAVETFAPDEVPNYKLMLPREYLVKWEGRSYHRAQWVPHMWLVAMSTAKLKNFLARGSLVALLPPPDSNAPSKGATPFLEDASGRSSPAPSDEIGERESGPPPASSNAFDRIPRQWYTTDRVLDVRLWCPPGCGRQHKKAKHDSGRRVVEDDEDEDMSIGSTDPPRIDALQSSRVTGIEPDPKMTVSIVEWEKRHGRDLSDADIDLVVWAYCKYVDIEYEQGTWDAPPDPSDARYSAFEKAFHRFLVARTVLVKEKARPNKSGSFQEIQGQPNFCQEEGFALRDFQLDGLNWLYFNWWKGQSSILADEMGLGKTVQMTTLIAWLVAHHDAFPILVIVPNSTLSNWLREFERWAPDVRVVPFFGGQKSRDIIKQYELNHHPLPRGYSPSKFHVLLSTYESLTNVKDGFGVFSAVKMWEAIVIDEGQRLKNDTSMLFRRLAQLNSRHRILMTGTPLNNNIRELFNLMNFLDPNEWDDLPGLEEKYKDLTEELLSELHDKLKPYFLRRTKADVLKLPPKNELIVPVTMTALQKTVYRSLLAQNTELLTALLKGLKGTKVAKTKLNNILMQLRKCIQHPYLVDPALEPRDVSKVEVHRNLVDASAKLQLLKVMLPQLRSRGHRVLLFSQFRIALDVIEDFLVAEGYSFRRLDGETKQSDRQKYMDEFNAENSDVFIFILSTRAGGVGINLYTADTVIVFDPDYNPHQDLQAIARAHRYGQQKTVLVFKFMMKGSAEEKIMQAGKKKLALDHLIVQSMDDDNSAGDDVQTLLTFGAKALFEEDSTTETISYSSADVEQLIIRTESAVDVEQEEVKKGGLSFEFARIWLPDKGTVDELQETDEAALDENNWDKVLQRVNAEQEAAKQKALQELGRGARRNNRRAVNYAVDASPDKLEKKGKGRKSGSMASDDDHDVDFTLPEAVSSDDDTSSFYGDMEDRMSLDEPVKQPASGLVAVTPASSMIPPPSTVDPPVIKKVRKRKLADQDNVGLHDRCGLCHQRHGPKACYMVNNHHNLLEYRRILFDKDVDEPYETRAAAVHAIDQELLARGFSELLRTLPIMPSHPLPIPSEHKAKKRKTDSGLDANAPKATDARINETSSASSRLGPSTSTPVPPFTSQMRSLTAEGLHQVVPSASADGPSNAALPTTKSVVALSRLASTSSDQAPSGMRQMTLPFSRKDSKTLGDVCPVCEKLPHPLVNCPIVQESESDLQAAIQKLKGKPGMEGTVAILRQLWTEKYLPKPSASSSNPKTIQSTDVARSPPATSSLVAVTSPESSAKLRSGSDIIEISD